MKSGQMKHTAFISGSSRGIGKAVALLLAKHGYTVIIHGSSESENAAITLRELRRYSRSAEFISFDVSDHRQVEKGCRKILKRYQVDAVINCAGILRDRTLINMTYEEWDTVVRTNLYGPFFVIKQFLKPMVAAKSGRIINISSVIGHTGNFGQANYAASKAGLLGLTKSLAKETARYGITVNAICPGLVDTGILNEVPEENLQKLLANIPLRRLAQPEEIAELVLYLLSPRSRYITGACIDINGGWF